MTGNKKIVKLFLDFFDEYNEYNVEEEYSEKEHSEDECNEEDNILEFENSNFISIFLNDIYCAMDYVFKFIVKICKYIFNIAGIYFLWIILHYLASQLYVRYCVPNSLFGFVISPFMVSTPHCQGLRWVVYNAANIINNMWTILGAWICSTILIVNQYKSFEEK